MQKQMILEGKVSCDFWAFNEKNDGEATETAVPLLS